MHAWRILAPPSRVLSKMSCWSAKSLVSSIARALDDQRLDDRDDPFVSDEPQEVGLWKDKKIKTIGVAQNMKAANCFGDVPSTVAPNILGGQQQRNDEGV